MSERSRLAYPGGFVPLAAMASRLDDLDPCCALCSCIGDERSWFHASSQRIVCSRCLPDPWADEGEAGRRAAERLVDDDLSSTDSEVGLTNRKQSLPEIVAPIVAPTPSPSNRAR